VYKRVLALYRTVVGENHPAVARTLHNLAIVYQNLGQYPEAERFYQKAIAVFTGSLGAVDGSVAASRLEYGLLLSELGRADEAIKEAQAALDVYMQLAETWGIQRAYATSSLGFALHRAGRLEEAIETFRAATALMAKLRGEGSSDLPPGLTQLGEIYLKLGRLKESDASLERAIAIREKDRAATPAGIAKSLAVLAQLRLKQGQPEEALAVARRYVGVTEARLDIAQRALSAAALGEQRVSRKLFEQFLEIARVNRPDEALRAEMFQVAQLPHISGTAAAVSRMAARFSAQLGTLATLVRERQDAIERWQVLDRQLTERLGGTQKGSASEAELRVRLSTLAEQIRRLDERLEHEFPDYAELTNPRPVALDPAQRWLKPHEALLLQVSTDTGTFVFWLRPGAARVVHTEMTKATLEHAVRSLREGLDLRRGNLSRPP
ncbi:MAG: tetratricopeptide repeat protein, partial [Gammaproteobacteria bacterium]